MPGYGDLVKTIRAEYAKAYSEPLMLNDRMILEHRESLPLLREIQQAGLIVVPEEDGQLPGNGWLVGPVPRLPTDLPPVERPSPMVQLFIMVHGTLPARYFGLDVEDRIAWAYVNGKAYSFTWRDNWTELAFRVATWNGLSREIVYRNNPNPSGINPA